MWKFTVLIYHRQKMKITCVHQLMSKYIYPKEYFPTIKRKEIYMLIYADVWAPWQSSPKRPDTVNHIVRFQLDVMSRTAVLVSVAVIKCSDLTLRKERVYFGLHSKSQHITERSQGRNLKASLLAILHSTLTQGTCFTTEVYRNHRAGAR